MEQLQKSRRNLRVSYIITILVSVAVTIVVTELLCSAAFDASTSAIYSSSDIFMFKVMFYVLIFAFMFSVLILPVAWHFRKNYSRDFRGHYFDIALRKYFERVDWEPKEGYTKDFIESLGIINTGYRFRSDNHFECRDKNLCFEMADVKVTTYWVQEAGKAVKKKSLNNPAVLDRNGYAFHGQLMALDTKLNCKSDLKIVPNVLADLNLSGDFGGNVIETGIDEFDKKFIIYCDDEYEAARILTRGMLSEIWNFADNSKCRYYFAFEGSKLYIGIHSFGMGKYLKVGSSFKKQDGKAIETLAEENVKGIKDLLEFVN